MSGKMIEFKKSPKRIEFVRWAAKWGQVTGTTNPRFEGIAEDGALFAVFYDAARANDAHVALWPCDVAEVCNYIPRGFRAGHAASFDKNGDLLIV